MSSQHPRYVPCHPHGARHQPIRFPVTVVRLFDFWLVFTPAGVITGVDA